jgi:tetratricopeptide (TPR) repeat protein
VARDFYRRCVEEDPGYAPAWARLGRIHHVIAKWLGTDAAENLDRAGVAFKRALEINPDHPLAHKFFAQLDIDFGRAEEAMARLLRQARTADPELFSGLVSVCRYCGLLDASIAADARARQLDSRVSTSIVHTWFLRGDHDRVVGTKLEENPYIVVLSFDAVGRTAEVIGLTREVERKIATRKRDFMMVATTLLEGKTDQSIAAANRIAASDFCDPEGLFYMARHLAHLNEIDRALGVFRRVVEGGFCCYPPMAADPWLDRLRARPEFVTLLRQAEARHRQAASTFTRMHGDAVLGAGSPP